MTFVPLRGSTAGRQYAGWRPRTLAVQGLGIAVLTGQRVPVADGVTLNADVYTPRTPGRYPAVVAFAAYSSETHTAGLPSGTNEAGSPPVFTDRGYCPVIVERRGMGRSTGDAVPFFDPQDVDDHEAVISWAARQPWCNGEVVLFGTSYYAITQVFVAARRPPALRGFFAHEPDTDTFRHSQQFGGVPGSFFLGVWLGANFTDRAQAARMSPTRRALLSHLTNGPLHPLLDKLVHHQVGRTFARVLGNTPGEPYAELYTRWLFEEKTREESTAQEVTPAELAAVDVPFVCVQNLGYFNLHQFGAYDLFEHTGTPDADKWLVLGPPVYDLPVYEWQLEALAFFDHILRGTDNGYAEQPHVRYWIDGAERFGAADAFPPPAGEVRRLHPAPRADADADADADTHRLSAEAPAEGQQSWAAVPRGVPVLPGIDRIAPQTLSFDLPVTEDLLLAGPVTAQFSVSSNEIDTYVLARLRRIDAAGVDHQLSMGAIRPAARTPDLTRGSATEIAIDSGRREPLVPGEPVTLRFSLTPAPVLLRDGETLRLDIASRSDLLRQDPTRGYAQFDLPVPPYLCRNTLHVGTGSWIEVTALPASDAPPHPGRSATSPPRPTLGQTRRRRRVRLGAASRLALATLLGAALLLGAGACAPAAPAPPPAGTTLRSQVGFGFDITDLQTDHQFPGQRSSFHVSYVYRDGLQGAGFDPAGRAVPADTYPYFQDIREDMESFIRTYPDKGDFYEVFLGDLARDVMTRYPQLASLDIRIDVPAYGGVPTARTGTVHLTRS